MRQAQDRVEPLLAEFGRARFGQKSLLQAMDAFSSGDETIAVDGPEQQLFMPWLFYTCKLVPEDDGRTDLQGPRRTLAEEFLLRRGYAVGAMEREFIEACVGAPHSFFDVLSADPGVGLRLKDILLGTDHDVIERTGSLTLRPGDVVYGRVAAFEGFALLVGTGSIPLRPAAKQGILALRKSLRERHGEITPALLDEMDEPIRKIYLGAREAALNPPMPSLTNTDGDPLEFHQIHYEIESAERAFQALRTLAVGESEEDLRDCASVAKDGRIKSIEFPWLKRGNRMNKGWENTILGSILIRGKRLTVEVNSTRRARKIRAIIEKKLAGDARYLRTTAESAEVAMSKRSRRRDKTGDRTSRESAELLAIPEVRARFDDLMAAHYEDWPDHPLPALGGKTPRQAVADPEGREMVEALLTEFEEADREQRAQDLHYDFSALRRRLGLAPRQE
jgi:uncharacterized protein (DUF2384 family)